jgi:hypothetical protein
MQENINHIGGNEMIKQCADWENYDCEEGKDCRDKSPEKCKKCLCFYCEKAKCQIK